MMAEFTMPSLGADMEAGTLVEWCVHPGDRVHRGDIVAVVETQKGAIDVEIYQDGVVKEILVPEGTQVPVGTPLAILEVEGEAAPASAATPVSKPAEPIAPQSIAPATPTVAPTPAAGRVAASPLARRRARELGVDLASVTGTGPHGAVTAEDIQQAASKRAPTPSAAVGMRAAIANAMSKSKREIPHYYLAHTIDLDPAMQWLEANNAKASPVERILPVVLLVRAVAAALREYPEFRGAWIDGGFVPAEAIHIGLAVVTREGGLINPAIHDADRGSLVELMASIRDLTARVRSGGLRSSELSDGVITITSLGDRGVDRVFGVIHPPQVAIVGFGTVRTAAWVVDGQVVPRRVVDVTLSADHRVSDGHRGALFLFEVAQRLAHPETL